MPLSTVRFTPLGGAGEVGANCFCLEIGGLLLLLDCGLHPKKEGLEALPDFSYLDRAPDAVIVTHAHMDHCGAVPYLLKRFPSTAAFATGATVSIMDRMLHNSVSVMTLLKEEQQIGAYPLYEHADVDVAQRRIYGIDVGRDFAVAPGSPVRITFSPAGHVLGSATITVDAPGHCLFYTGDICMIDQELIEGFSPPLNGRDVDTLIIESTYGANEEADGYDYAVEVDRFAADTAAVLEGGGVVLAPSFALGRSQEVLNMVARLQEAGRVPEVPVYGSGLGRAVYEVYTKFSDELRPGADLRPLSQFRRVGDVWDPAVLGKLFDEPGIIVATSGMMIEKTPSAMIARRMVRETGHGIFFVGYTDPDTLGFRVRNARKGDRLRFLPGEEPVEVALENIRSYRFSAHAPRGDLCDIVDHFDAANLVFVHGDPPAIEWMHENCGDGSAKFAPRIGETIRLAE